MDMINSLGIVCVAGITIIVYLLGMIVRASGLDNKWIPAICGVAGAVLGVVGMYIMPEFPAGDVLNAVAVGIASGLAATGADQMVKQLKKDGDEEMNDTVAALLAERQRLLALVEEYEAKQEAAAEGFAGITEEVE